MTQVTVFQRGIQFSLLLLPFRTLIFFYCVVQSIVFVFYDEFEWGWGYNARKWISRFLVSLSLFKAYWLTRWLFIRNNHELNSKHLAFWACDPTNESQPKISLIIKYDGNFWSLNMFNQCHIFSPWFEAVILYSVIYNGYQNRYSFCRLLQRWHHVCLTFMRHIYLIGQSRAYMIFLTVWIESSSHSHTIASGLWKHQDPVIIC